MRLPGQAGPSAYHDLQTFGPSFFWSDPKVPGTLYSRVSTPDPGLPCQGEEIGRLAKKRRSFPTLLSFCPKMTTRPYPCLNLKRSGSYHPGGLAMRPAHPPKAA